MRTTQAQTTQARITFTLVGSLLLAISLQTLHGHQSRQALTPPPAALGQPPALPPFPPAIQWPAKAQKDIAQVTKHYSTDQVSAYFVFRELLIPVRT